MGLTIPSATSPWLVWNAPCDRTDDAIHHEITKAVVRQYQTDSGLPVAGVMDERTWMAPAGAAGATLESPFGSEALTDAGVPGSQNAD